MGENNIADGLRAALGHADPDSEWWWTALQAGQLLLPACTSCKKLFLPPMARCPHCGSAGFEVLTASGRGSIYSWVVLNHAFDPVFAADTGVIVAAIDLEEGPRILARLSSKATPVPGARVRAVHCIVNGVVVPGFDQLDASEATKGD